MDKKHVQSLQIVNASTEVINMHIIPPQTKYFYIKYKKTVRVKDEIPMLNNFQDTSLKWGGGGITLFFLIICIVSPTYQICTDVTICTSFKDNIYYQVRDN